jgi:hypothetical protein
MENIRNFVKRFTHMRNPWQRRCVHSMIDKEFVDLGKRFNITILPLDDIECEFTDLYPTSDNTNHWNTFIVGRDKSYIQATVFDLHLDNHERLIQTDELKEFFNPIWDKTLSGCNVQFMMIWLSRTYVVNTYPMRNFNNNVIGAMMFIRNANAVIPLLQKQVLSRKASMT